MLDEDYAKTSDDDCVDCEDFSECYRKASVSFKDSCIRSVCGGLVSKDDFMYEYMSDDCIERYRNLLIDCAKDFSPIPF